MNTQDEEDLEDFLRKVDEIGGILEDLRSNDAERREKGEKRAENFDGVRTLFSRTCINPNAAAGDEPRPCSTLPTQCETIQEPEIFMKALEQDALERAANKQRQLNISNQLKEEGNIQFKNYNFDEAEKLYTKGMEACRDNIALYTNRAQCYLRTEKFEEAIADCDVALTLNNSCFKAHLIKGRCLANMKQFERAKTCFAEALKADKDKQNIVQNCIRETCDAERHFLKHQDCVKKIDEGDSDLAAVVDYIHVLRTDMESSTFYGENMTCLAKICEKNADAKSLFRFNGGFELVRKWILKHGNSIAAADENFYEMLLKPLLQLLISICKKNEENQNELMKIEEIPDCLQQLVNVGSSTDAGLLVTQLLYTYTLTEKERTTMVQAMNGHRLLKMLVSMIEAEGPKGEMSISILNNLVLDERFRATLLLSPFVDDLLCLAVEKVKSEIKNKTRDPKIVTYVTVLSNAAQNEHLRNTISNYDELWASTIHILELSYEDEAFLDMAYSLLGLVINLSHPHFPKCANPFASKLVPRLVALLGKKRLCSRVCRVLSHLQVSNPAIFRSSIVRGMIAQIIQLLEEALANNTCNTKGLVHTLVTLTKHNMKARKILVQQSDGICVLAKLIEEIPNSETAAKGNAALCIMHCCTNHPVVADLVGKEIIPKLLDVIQTTEDIDMKRNCAFLLGKLASLNNNHLIYLRQLHGFEILHHHIGKLI